MQEIYITKERKHELEKKAIERLLSTIDFENDFLQIWEEYEKQKKRSISIYKTIG